MVGFILTLGFAVGLVLLVVPGVILYLMWSQAACVTVIERLGVMAALQRSRYLTSGARWTMFGLWLIESVAFVAAGLAIHSLMRLLGQSTVLIGGASWASIVGWLIANVIQTTVLGVIGHTVRASLYVELRDWKDGTPGDRLATVFA